MRRRAIWLAAVATAVLCAPNVALAVSGIPFHGVLNSGGAAADGPYHMTFSLYDSLTATTPLWSEVYDRDPPATTPADHGPPVQVVAGKFAVFLGAYNPLTSAVRDATDLYLGIAVAGVALSGRQRLGAVAQSISAMRLEGNDVLRTQKHQLFPVAGEGAFSTASTSYVQVGHIVQDGIEYGFLPPLPGTVRRYRFEVSTSNNVPSSNPTPPAATMKYMKGSSDCFAFDLPPRWSDGTYASTFTTARFDASTAACTANGHGYMMVEEVTPGTTWIWGIWVVAEDVLAP